MSANKMKVHVKKGDTVEVLSGKDRGKRGKILKVIPREGKILVDGINVVKRHTRPRPPKVPQGGILEKAMPIYSSRVMLVCPSCNEATRIGKNVLDDGTRARACKSCGKEIGR